MSKNTTGMSCAVRCWLLSLLGGAIVFVILMSTARLGFGSSIFFGLLSFLLGGVFLNWAYCRPSQSRGDIPPDHAVVPAPEEKLPAAMVPEAYPVAEKAPAAAPAAAEPKAAKAKPAPKAKAEKAVKAPKAAKAEPEKAAAPEGKPEMLTAARAGGPDDLKLLKGVGPKLESELHKVGVFHFDQVASWGPKEVEWMDENLQGVRGRVSRNGWVEQARILASGGTTEFAARAKKGGVNEG